MTSFTNIKIQECNSAEDYAIAIRLSLDYLKWLNMDLKYQRTEIEFRDFEKMYAAPKGAFYYAIAHQEVAGGLGLRYLTEGVCEMKRLFVYPSFQNQGIGKQLCLRLLQGAKKLGYDVMKLDTVAKLESAISLYQKLGFTETEAYCENPDTTAKFFELKL